MNIFNFFLTVISFLLLIFFFLLVLRKRNKGENISKAAFLLFVLAVTKLYFSYDSYTATLEEFNDAISTLPF